MKQDKPTLIARDGGYVCEDLSEAEYFQALQADVLARTIWGEARNQGDAGMAAVANVVMNRVRISMREGGYWWGHDVVSICQKPYQFSCWNRSDPNFKKLLGVDEEDLYFATALRHARRAVIGCLPDMTEGATHYHAKGVSPFWARGEKPCCVIGDHIFYRLTA